ncbi:MAG: MarP family serine protease [Acidimicrobiales bacterium]
MDALDIALVVLASAAAAGGWRAGFTTRVASWLGVVVGTFLASRLLPTVVEHQLGTNTNSLLLLVVVILFAGAVLGQVTGMVIGLRMRVAIPSGPAQRVDRVSGAAAGFLGVMLAFWLLLPTMADTPGWASQQARASYLAGFVHDRLPEPPDTVRALRRLVGVDIFPRVLDGLGAAPALGAPPPESGVDAGIAQQAAASTVQVESQACSRVREGSGVVLGDGLVVTNAHVVAGSERTRVFRHPDGEERDATIVAFDAAHDVAVLRVPDIERAPLRIDDGSFGEGGVGAVFGHPLGGPLELQPFAVGREVRATGRDIYDEARTERKVFFLASHLQPGDSGGALVDGRGVVVGLAFAIAPDDPDVAYALTVEEINPVLASAGTTPVDPGPCLG